MLDATDLLTRAVTLKSVSGDEAEVARFLVEQMAFCDEAFVDAAGNAVGKVGRGPLKIHSLGHIDTVPGDVPVRVEAGRLYGRGSVDAKGSFCAAVAAASRLGPHILEKITLLLIGATEEEVPTSKGARHALEVYPQPDFVIVGEPSGWDAVTLGYKGRLVAKLSVAKANFHSAGAGTTAAEDLVEAWNRLKAQADRYNEGVGMFDALQVTLQNVDSRADGLTQSAAATLSYRLPPALLPERVKRMVSEQLGPARCTFSGAETAYRGDKDTPLTRAFRVAIRQHGGEPRFKVKTGTADMNVVAPQWAVPMLAYGPGDSALDHTPDENLPLQDYQKAVAVLATAFARLAEMT